MGRLSGTGNSGRLNGYGLRDVTVSSLLDIWLECPVFVAVGSASALQAGYAYADDRKKLYIKEPGEAWKNTGMQLSFNTVLINRRDSLEKSSRLFFHFKSFHIEVK